MPSGGLARGARFMRNAAGAISAEMTAKIIDGNAIAKRVRAKHISRVDALRARGLTPGLAVVLIGQNSDSAV